MKAEGFYGVLIGCWETFERVLNGLGRVSGGPWDVLGRSSGLLGRFRDCLGEILQDLEAFWDGLCGVFWAPWGDLWGFKDIFERF